MTTSRLKSGASLPEFIAFREPSMGDGSNRVSWSRWLAFILVALVGLTVRIQQLAERPMHTDEAVNAYIVGQLLAGEPFTYDPQDRHGPALAAMALPLVRMQGAKSFSELTESELRMTSVVAGTITILLLGAAVEMFGFVPSLLTALLFAVAPLPVYYDRYFIHEPLFCAATLGLILCGWRAWRRQSIGHAVLAGACAALMLACKETAILHLFALASAALIFRAQNLRDDRSIKALRIGPLLAGTGTFLAIVVVLFTWFGRNRDGLTGLLHAVPHSVARAAGQGHERPFWYYGQLLASGWSGGVLLALACLGIFISIKTRRASPTQWLAYYGFLIAAIYSLIPYKTPWLALSLWLVVALFSAIAAVSLWSWASERLDKRAVAPIFCILAALVAVLLEHDTRERVFLRPFDESNPYAYAHTSDDILGLAAEIGDLARRDGILTPRIAVIAADPWPLPWYLRHFKQVGFWQPGQRVTEADFYITSTESAEQYSDQLRSFRPEFFGVRPNVLILLWSPAAK